MTASSSWGSMAESRSYLCTFAHKVGIIFAQLTLEPQESMSMQMHGMLQPLEGPHARCLRTLVPISRKCTTFGYMDQTKKSQYEVATAT